MTDLIADFIGPAPALPREKAEHRGRLPLRLWRWANGYRWTRMRTILSAEIRSVSPWGLEMTATEWRDTWQWVPVDVPAARAPRV